MYVLDGKCLLQIHHWASRNPLCCRGTCETFAPAIGGSESFGAVLRMASGHSQPSVDGNYTFGEATMAEELDPEP